MCWACGYDLKLLTGEQRGKINQTLGILRKAEKTQEQFAHVVEYWKKMDWRGKQGQPMRPDQIREIWGAAMDWKPVSNGKDPRIPEGYMEFDGKIVRAPNL